MAKAKPRVRVPKKAAKGDVIEIKSLISHKMESGRRKGKDGKLVPRQIINRFEVQFNGQDIFSADWHPSVSANPYMAFPLKVEEEGTLSFKWIDDDGSVYTKESKIKLA
ncbi:MAG: thiosulfate oxidation carrier complex protein SoxZ [Magnetovibrionaceae bacterium]